jgi:trigger factor
MNVAPEELEKGIQAAYLKSRNKIQVPGFRKGKVPRSFIEKTYGKEFFYEEAINEILPDAYESALDEHLLDAVSRPTFEAPEIDREKGAVIVATFFVKPEINLTGYMGIKYKKPSEHADESEINAQIEQERKKNARAVTVTDRPAENGDIVNIDFEGFVDGVPFDGGKSDGHELVIGSKTFIDDFEEQIIGHNIGDEFDVNVTFPDPYGNEDLAGKDAVFKVKVNSIEFNELPALDDDFAQEVSEFETFEEYKNDIAATIEKNKKENVESEIEGLVIMELIKMVDELNPAIPEEMYENEMDSCARDFARNLSVRGININQYLNYMGLDGDSLRESFRPNAINNVKGRLALEAAAKNEDFEIGDEEFSAELDRMAVEYNIERDKIETVMGKREIEMLRKDLKVKKTIKKIVENAVAE